MFTSLATLIDRANFWVRNARGGKGVPAADFLELARNVAPVLAKYKPRTVRGTLSGDGASYQVEIGDDDLPGWIDGLSQIVLEPGAGIEYPLDQRPRSFLPSDEWEWYPSSAAPTHLHFKFATPAAGDDNIGIDHTAAHTITDADDQVDPPVAAVCTVPEADQLGYEYYLAGMACETYATMYGQTTDPAVTADSVNYRSKEAEWRRLAEMFFGRASSILGVDVNPGAGAANGAGAGGAGGSIAGTGAEPASGWANVQPQASSAWGSPLYRTRRQH